MTDTTKQMHTQTPWSIRPQELDDWGIIRGSNGHVACIAREPVYNDDEALNEHRNRPRLHRRYSSDRRLWRGSALLAEWPEVEIEF